MPPVKSIVAPASTGVMTGALFGLALTADLKLFQGWLRANWPWAGMLLGGLIGWAGAVVWIFRARIHFATRVTSVKIELPVVGKLEMALTPSDRAFLWRFFVELATRVSTQRLGADEGILREALKSLYDLYSVARPELASAPPAGLPFTQISARAYVIDILNKELRPFLSRWHPLLSAWEKTSLPAATWPLQLCRADLATTRDRILWRAWDLGAALNVQGLENILPPRPGTLEELLPADQIRAHDPDPSRFDPERVKVGWRIFVECASRVSTQRLAADTGLLHEALQSLHDLFGTIRDELKTVRPVPSRAVASETVESLSFRLLNHHLRPFLANWHPKLLAWENEQQPNGKKNEADNLGPSVSIPL